MKNALTARQKRKRDKTLMKKAELMQRVLENTTIAELIMIINNQDIIKDSIEEQSRIAFVRKNIKSINKNILTEIVKNM